MNHKHRALMAGLGTAMIAAFLWYVGGFNFDERKPETAFACFSIVGSGIIVTAFVYVALTDGGTKQ